MVVSRSRAIPPASTEMTPVRGDDEEHTADGESDSRDDRPRSGHFELRDLCGGQPDPSEQKE